MDYFKVIVFVSIFLTAVVFGDEASEQRKKFLDVEKKALIKCQKEGNYPESYIEDLFTKEVVPPNSKCFVKCAFENIGFLNKDGYVNLPSLVEGMKQLFADPTHEEASVALVIGCYNKVPKELNQCDSSSQILDCIFKGGDTDKVLKDVVHSEGH